MSVHPKGWEKVPYNQCRGTDRQRRQIDGNTFEFTCGGHEGHRAHVPVTWIARTDDADCPVCEAMQARAEIQRRWVEMHDTGRRFLEMLQGAREDNQ